MDTIFVEVFGGLEDPRVDRTKKHLLLDIIAIAICSVIAGAESWEEMEDFARDQYAWLIGFLNLPNGIPSHDTISRVFGALNPAEFQKACMEWFRSIKELEPETVVALDGKTLRGSARKRTGLKGLHIVNAWSCANGMSLGQCKVDSKSNEITAIPKLLKQLALKGAIVTLDAMGCQKKITKDIHEAGAEYVIAVKKNQGRLCEAIEDTFSLNEKGKGSLGVYAHEEVDAGHGRVETRKVETVSASELGEYLPSGWFNLNTLIRVTSKREVKSLEQSVEQRFYISSLSASDPEKILQSIRSHWQVENCLHWSLDVTFSEDSCRIHDDNTAQNYSWMRKFALGLLKNEKSFKASIRRKQRKVLSSSDYLGTVISSN